MTRPVAYDNLIANGNLKPAARNPLSIQQYLRVANDTLSAAKITTISPHAQYILAYEGIFSVVMAVLEHYETRPGEGDGHRIIAIQRVAGDLKVDPDEFSAITRLHAERNRAVYRSSIPPINKAQAEAAISILGHMYEMASKLLTGPSV